MDASTRQHQNGTAVQRKGISRHQITFLTAIFLFMCIGLIFIHSHRPRTTVDHGKLNKSHIQTKYIPRYRAKPICYHKKSYTSKFKNFKHEEDTKFIPTASPYYKRNLNNGLQSGRVINFILRSSVHHVELVRTTPHRIKHDLSTVGFRSGYMLLKSYTCTIKDKADIPISNFMNVEYYGEISVGSPGKAFRVLFDTGSADTWIPSSFCGWRCMDHLKYSHNKSNTYLPDGKETQLQYASGRIAGFKSRDKFTIGDLSVDNYTLIEATDALGMGIGYEGMRFDGVVGMGLADLSLFKTTPFVVELYNRGLITSPVFSFFLTAAPGIGSSLVLGGSDRSHYEGEVTWHPNLSDKFWSIDMSGITLNMGKKKVKVESRSFSGILDTGTSFLVMPVKPFKRLTKIIRRTVELDNFMMFNCKRMDLLPIVTFKTPLRDYPLSPDDYVYKLISGDEEICVIAILPLPHEEDVWILGDIFLRKYYSIHDYGANQIGLASAIQAP